MKYGFIKTAAAIPNVQVGDCAYNAQQIITMMKQAQEAAVEMICFPELSISAYTCGDLFFQDCLLREAEAALQEVVKASQSMSLLCIVGMPLQVKNQLFNTAVAIQKGHILAVIPKSYLPNNNEFYERRWFASAAENNEESVFLCGEEVAFGTDILLTCGKVIVGIELCEDLWTAIPPSCHHSLAGANVLFNLSASNDLIGKHDYLRNLVLQQSGRCVCAYIYASSGHGESTTDVVFGGNAFICENGSLLQEAKRFDFQPQIIISDMDVERLLTDRMRNTCFKSDSYGDLYTEIPFELTTEEDTDKSNKGLHTQPKGLTSCRILHRDIHPLPFVPADDKMSEHCEEIFSIQVGGLAKRLLHTGMDAPVIGISGGLDSTLALLVCVKTFDKLGWDRKKIIAITMPGFGTTQRTHSNALQLMRQLGVTDKEISIHAACEQHFQDICHDPSLHNVVYENAQARERTQILMDCANQCNGLVIGTGDLSELALGWATYNGDQMSMYGVNSGIPKTLVKYLVHWVAQTQVDESSKATLMDILDTPVSPELLPADKDGNIAQKTEDLVGPYELHDFFLYYMIRFGFAPAKIQYMAQIAFAGTYDEACIEKWLRTFIRRFFQQQFKRSCMPDGPKVGSINLSPRGDWRMPSDAVYRAWLENVETKGK